MTRTALSLLGLLAFAILAGWCLSHGGAIQDRLRDQVSERLSAAGLTGIEVSADGLDVTLAGTLTSEEAVAEAERIAGGHPGARRLNDLLAVGRPGNVRLSSAGGELTISGALAGEAARRRIVAAATIFWGERHDATALDVDPQAPPVQRPDALVSVIALLRDTAGRFELGWGPPVDVDGEVSSEAAKGPFLARLGALTADWEIREQIRVTPRAVADDLAGMLARRRVEFASDSARLTAAGRQLLEEVAKLLVGAPGARFVVEGHTDSQASESYNLELSRRRADAVRDYLVATGIAPARLETEGLGESQPVASNDTAEGRRENRRVAFRLLEEEGP